ncbi:uncharacterized protein LOC141648242 [Silene latifolia]|uniref:uncharacterized protein LOC141648242 n=1 Tax=Silene latifolia TaxID=37657 RepID=UPI003D77C5D3
MMYSMILESQGKVCQGNHEPPSISCVNNKMTLIGHWFRPGNMECLSDAVPGDSLSSFHYEEFRYILSMLLTKDVHMIDKRLRMRPRRSRLPLIHVFESLT